MSDLAVGQAVLSRRYRLERLLGVGSTGPVWLGVDQELGVSRALKFLSELAADELDALKAETLRSQELTHQNIVRIYDFVRDEHHAAICMEAIDGPDLRAAQRERNPPCFHADELRFWMEELCRALHHAHTFAKVIHRDLKPSNLLISRHGHLKIADFGIAQAIPKRLVRQDEGRNKIAGTLEYVSPQQMEGLPPAVADDIYSFGATLFELLSGRPPFMGDALFDTARNRSIPSLAELRYALEEDMPIVSKKWEDVIQACLASDPRDRPGSIREVAHQLGLELRQVTIQEPVLPEGFLPASFEMSEDPKDLPTLERRVRTLHELPIPNKPPRWWPWLVGVGATLTVFGLSFCRPSAQEPRPISSPTSSIAITPAPAPPPPPTNVLETSSNDEEPALLDQVYALLNQRELARALETLRALLAKDPHHAEAARLKAEVHASLTEWQATRPAVSWAIAQPGNASHVENLKLLRGRANRHLGHLDQAIADFNQVLRSDKHNANALYLRGLAYREQGDLQRAILDLTATIQTDPQHVDARKARARLLLQDNQLATATATIIEDLDYALAADPEDVDARVDRLRCYHQAQNWKGLIDDATTLLDKQPDWPDVVQLRTIATLKLGKAEEASLADLRTYTRQYPDDLNSWFTLAEKLLATSKFSEARDAFAEIIRRDPNATDAYEGRAFAYYSIAKELTAADKQSKLRHAQRLLGIADINTFISRAPERASADTYLLKTKLHFYRGGPDYAHALETAREGRTRFPEAAGEFDWWIEEVQVASKLEKDKTQAKRGRGRPDRPNWFERFFKRSR